MKTIRTAEDFCALTEEIGYKKGNYLPSGYLNNSSRTSSLLNFLDDNPGALELLAEFVQDNFSECFEEDNDGEDDE